MSEENNVIPFIQTRVEIAQCCDNCNHSYFSVVEDRSLGYLVICDNCSSTIGKMTLLQDGE